MAFWFRLVLELTIKSLGLEKLAFFQILCGNLEEVCQDSEFLAHVQLASCIRKWAGPEMFGKSMVKQGR